MRELWITCGPPFSGKSTLARKLARRTGSLVVAFDRVREAEEIRQQYAGYKPDEWHHTQEYARARVVDALLTKKPRQVAYMGESSFSPSAVKESPRSVVYDGVSSTRKFREQLRHVANFCGAVPILVHCNVSREVLLSRIYENRRNPKRPDVAIGVLDMVAATFEPPTADELPITLTSPAEVEALIRELPANRRDMQMTRVVAMIGRALRQYQTVSPDWRQMDDQHLRDIAKGVVDNEERLVCALTPHEGELRRVLCRAHETEEGERYEAVAADPSGVKRTSIEKFLLPGADYSKGLPRVLGAYGVNYYHAMGSAEAKMVSRWDEFLPSVNEIVV